MPLFHSKKAISFEICRKFDSTVNRPDHNYMKNKNIIRALRRRTKFSEQERPGMARNILSVKK
jgi:hypothetical protein